jgi:hypothetical protein
METNKKILGKINTQRCSVTLTNHKMNQIRLWGGKATKNALNQAEGHWYGVCGA